MEKTTIIIYYESVQVVPNSELQPTQKLKCGFNTEIQCLYYEHHLYQPNLHKNTKLSWAQSTARGIYNIHNILGNGSTPISRLPTTVTSEKHTVPSLW